MFHAVLYCSLELVVFKARGGFAAFAAVKVTASVISHRDATSITVKWYLHGCIMTVKSN